VNQFEVLLTAVEDGRAVQMVTLIAGPAAHAAELGQMLMLFSSSQVEGSIINAEFTGQVLLELSKLKWSKPSILLLNYQQSEYQLFWNVVGNEKKQAIVFGGGHISQPLVKILGILDYEVTVVDDRLEFANQERFPEVQQVVCNSFASILQDLEPDDKTAIIIVTRGHQYDLDCLRSIIATKAGYIGMIGSRRKVEATLQILQKEGVSQHLLDRVRAPIGLDLGGQSPGEIAVSIAAEVVAAFNGGHYLPLSRLAKGVHDG